MPDDITKTMEVFSHRIGCIGKLSDHFSVSNAMTCPCEECKDGSQVHAILTCGCLYQVNRDEKTALALYILEKLW